MSARRNHSWFILLACGVVLLGISLLIVWWLLPVMAPDLTLRIFRSGTSSERAVVRLIELTCDHKQVASARLGDHHAHPSLAPGVLRAFHHERADIRRAIIQAAVPSDIPTLFTGLLPPEELATALSDPDPRTRICILLILRKGARYRMAVDPLALTPVTKDTDREVRLELARYARARKIGETSLLLTADQDPLIREIAVGGLNLTADPTRADKTLHLLNDPEPAVRIAFIKALGELGDERALPVLIAGLNSTDTGAREALVNALGKIEDIRALPALVLILKDPEISVRRAAANALGIIGDPRAVTALADCSQNDTDRSVRCAAVSALETIKDPATLDPLMQATKDPDPVVRAMAEAAINRRP